MCKPKACSGPITKLGWCSVAFSGLFPALAFAGTALSTPPHQSSIPFTLVDGRILLNVTINGHGPYRVIFDSGASAVLSAKVAHDLQLPLSDTGSENGTGAGAVEVAHARVPHLQIGGLHLDDQEFDVTSMRDMPPVFGTVRVDGILGRPVFDRAVVRIDYDRRVLLLIEPGRFHPAHGDVAIPFTRIRDVPLIEASLDHHAGRFGVDLGARSSLILTNSFAEQNHITDIFVRSPDMITGWGLGGPIRSKLARAGDFELGGFAIHGPLVRLSVQRSGLLAKSDIAGLIGADILRQFTITFDSVNKIIYLHPSKRFGRRATFDQSGMWLVQGKKAFDVLEVVDGGPASRAHIRVGDRVLDVDGRSAKELALAPLRDRWAVAQPGTKVILHLQREGVQQNAVLTLAPLFE